MSLTPSRRGSLRGRSVAADRRRYIQFRSSVRILACYGAVIAVVVLLGQRIMWSNTSSWVMGSLAVAIIGSIYALIDVHSGSARWTPKKRWLTVWIPTVLLLGSYPGWVLFRNEMIERDSAYAQAIIVEVTTQRLSSRRTVRARFVANGKTYLTTWLPVTDRAHAVEGNKVRVRYSARDPRVATLAE